MAESIPLGQPLQPRLGEQAYGRADAIPWTIWCMFAGIACGLVGGQWDISWHLSIGRDTFWTPAHILIQLTGVLVGMACGYMILTATFGRDTAIQSRSVKIWGFRGPLGAFIATWGCMAMLTSAPFDNWWHNAYGLDVKIVSPPHTLLSLGSFAIKIGTLALMAGLMNRSEEKVRGEAHAAFRVRGSGLRFATRDHPYHIDLAREHARREMLPGGGHRDSSGASGYSVGFGAALGVHPGSGNVHVDSAGI